MLSRGQELIDDLGIPGYGADEVGFMEETLLMVKPVFIADWGTNRGSSARIFYELCRIHSLLPYIVTTDLPISIARLDKDHAGQHTGHFLRDMSRSVIQLRGDGVTEALDQFARFSCPDEAIFFVDGDHSYHNVYRELGAIFTIAPHAVALLHDTRGDPGRALDDFLSDHPGKWAFKFLPSQAGMTRVAAP